MSEALLMLCPEYTCMQMTPMHVMYVIVNLEVKTLESHHNQETHRFAEKLDLSGRGYSYLVLVDSCKHKMIQK